MRVAHLPHKNRIVSIALAMTVLFAVTAPAQAATVDVSVTILSKSICRFDTKGVTLDFGALDAGNPVPIVVPVTIGFVCQGSVSPATYAISDDDGLYESGANANRMQHTVDPGQFIPYGLTLSTTSGSVPKMVAQTLTLTGSINGADYQSVAAGTYVDTVTLAIVP